MSKRAVSFNKRCDFILDTGLKDDKKSGIINTSLIDEFLPVFMPQLRNEALYLIDYCNDGASDWTGKIETIGHKSSRKTKPSNAEITMTCRQILNRGIEFMKYNHHIQNPQVLEEILAMFTSSQYSSGAELKELRESVQELIAERCRRIKEVDAKYPDFPIGLGSMAKDVIAHWDKLWDEDNSYNIIMAVVSYENPLSSLTPFRVINMLQWMEITVINEALKAHEKK